MKIAGYIEHPNCKITIFQMDNRFTVKFETERHEQAFKFSKSLKLNSADDIKNLIDDLFIQKVLDRFKEMYASEIALFQRYNFKESDTFPNIL